MAIDNGSRLAFAAAVAVLALLGAAVLPDGATRLSQPMSADVTGEPEAATGRQERGLARAKRHMAAAAHPLAAAAGLDILRAGGSALDAALATQLVLNIVEPQSSGLGGGAFIVHFDAATSLVASYDGRETAPAAARPERFMSVDRPVSVREVVHSGASVGVPGLARVMELAHRQHGKMAWPRLFEPALRLADGGFVVSPRLNQLLDAQGAASFDEAGRRFYFDAAGKAWPVGHLLRSPALAATLRALAANGADAFYAGPIAEAIVAAVANAPGPKGDLTLADLAAYRARVRDPVCVTYRRHRVCGMGPPSSGGLAVAMTLGLLTPFDLGGEALATPAVHLIVEAEKLAYADRDHYIADPDFVAVPRTLLDPAYLDRRRALVDPAAAMPKAAPGEPPGVKQGRFGADATLELAGTSHLSIVDSAGNAVAMTTTLEAGFGSRLMAAGFLLNNQLTDFSFRPRDATGALAANAVAPGKRPRSSMAPTIVLDEPGREVRAVLGSPGGSRIILYVVKSLIGVIDWGLDAQAAAALTNFGSRNGPLEVERGEAGAGLAARMTGHGHRLLVEDMTSGLHIIVRRDRFLEGGADPRREGRALGD